MIDSTSVCVMALRFVRNLALDGSTKSFSCQGGCYGCRFVWASYLHTWSIVSPHYCIFNASHLCSASLHHIIYWSLPLDIVSFESHVENGLCSEIVLLQQSI